MGVFRPMSKRDPKMFGFVQNYSSFPSFIVSIAKVWTIDLSQFMFHSSKIVYGWKTYEIKPRIFTYPFWKIDSLIDAFPNEKHWKSSIAIPQNNIPLMVPFHMLGELQNVCVCLTAYTSSWCVIPEPVSTSIKWNNFHVCRSWLIRLFVQRLWIQIC